MKKFIIYAIIALIFGTSTAYAGNDRPINVSQLPQKAQQFIKQHFPDEKVAYAKKERDLLKTNYEVVFTSGSKIEFRKDGEWKEIDCKYAKVPDAIIPPRIMEFVTTNYKGAAITEIDRDRRDYEIKLSNGLELTFDLKFNLIEIDD